MTSTSTYKKKLIEVAIPLEAINAASAREKSIRHGHPSTLHLWWARRPLAACRAVLFAQLVDDPSSNPHLFPNEEAIDAERKRLFKIIEKLVVWENSMNDEVLNEALNEIRRSFDGKLPAICDPFSGGGSIPLEAQRLGLDAYGSDLNPVPVLIGKAMIELPPKYRGREPVHPGVRDRNSYRNAEGLAEDVLHYGRRMSEIAESRIGHLFPSATLPKEKGGGTSSVIAWIWSRTVPSPDPAFSGAHVPIASSFLLSAKPGKETWLEPIVDKVARTIEYRVRVGGTEAELATAREGTKASRGANFKCLFSNAAISPSYVKQMGSAGKLGSSLIAVVAEGTRERIYLEPTIEHVKAAAAAVAPDMPPTRLPNHSQYVGVLGYGFETFSDLFTDRQLETLWTLAEIVKEMQAVIEEDSRAAFGAAGIDDVDLAAKEYAHAVRVYLAMAVGKYADNASTLCSWHSGAAHQKIRATFGRQALPMTWDYAEGNPFSRSSGNFLRQIELINRVVDLSLPAKSMGVQTQHDAQTLEMRNAPVFSTDPPYYDNIPYADLSDYFYIWLRLACGDVFPDLFSTLSVPKMEELVADRVRHGGADKAESFFLTGMTEALRRMCEEGSTEAPTTIYYAFKQSEIAVEGISSTGWATFLQAVLDAGYSVVGTWPVRTELANRMRGIGSNALANSVVLVCRRREISAETVSRAEFIRALKREVPPAIAELQAANITPADMPQSAIGPGMGVFSRYRSVLESDDSPMSVKAALQLINRELDEYLGGIQGEFDQDTRFAITWFEQHGSKPGEYGSANSIAQARGISVESVKHAGIVESAAGKVRIIARDDLDRKWDPESDNHLTVWECCQHLVYALENQGEASAALLLRKLGSEMAEAVKDLAYCLYGICEKRSDAKEALSYNALIAVWTELTRQAATIHDTSGERQTRLDL